jgi:hypothetical protein
MVLRDRVTLGLNLASLVRGLAGGVLAAYPAIAPFSEQELSNLTVDDNARQDTCFPGVTGS